MPRIHAYLDARDKQCGADQIDIGGMLGRKKEACELLERLLALSNDLGLFSEEYDPREKRLLGNFPQAFTHVALVTTVHFLEEE